MSIDGARPLARPRAGALPVDPHSSPVEDGKFAGLYLGFLLFVCLFPHISELPDKAEITLATPQLHRKNGFGQTCRDLRTWSDSIRTCPSCSQLP